MKENLIEIWSRFKDQFELKDNCVRHKELKDINGEPLCPLNYLRHLINPKDALPNSNANIISAYLGISVNKAIAFMNAVDNKPDYTSQCYRKLILESMKL